MIKRLLLLLTVGAAAGGGYYLARTTKHETATLPHAITSPYQCPMHAWIKLDRPGKCTICGMDLVTTNQPTGNAAGLLPTSTPKGITWDIFQSAPGDGNLEAALFEGVIGCLKSKLT
ncbi:MAG: hypothetical protein EBT98_11595, partial [Opitutaceae bacterium]|nr:hypothetical protein [Opitutaceae bacterium]